MQNIFTLETNKYNIRIDNFEGPLDLLCHLIDINKMDIYDVNVNEITDQYIDYINKMEEMDLEVTSEFLIMASNLLYIKSKKLLPRQEEAEEMLTEEELIQRIIQYKKYKEITSAFRKMFESGNKNIFKTEAEILELPTQELENNHNYKELSKIYEKLIEKNKVKINTNAKNIEKIAIIENFTVGDTVKTMYRELVRKSNFVFNRLFSVKKCKPQEVVTAFSGLLEMSRRDKVTTEQEKLFGDIKVYKKKRKKE